ncbi:amino acid adenylation domain-containing protein [Streptomyces sp. NPDC048441]|uniref:amino acid adenylation domain-containing protein n=1 Tax=Streptomyces sp. NPDC048441 TaxID=3365552 RepID=UPI0037220490
MQSAADTAAAAVGRIVAGALPADVRLDPDAPLAQHGLDSMTMARIALEVHSELGVELSLKELVDCRTPARLTALIDARRDSRGTAADAPAPPSTPEPAGDGGEAADSFPLTPLQEAYLVGKTLGDDRVGCHVYREFDVPDLDAGRLHDAWQRVIDHHDMLRAVIGEDGTQHVAPLAPPWTPTVHEVPGDGGDAAVDEHLAAVRARLSHHRYAPGAWPLFTVEVSRPAAPRPAVVHLSLDASLTDGQGINVLLDDWWQAYRQPERDLPAVGRTPRDCVRWLAEQRTTDVHRADLAYWRERLADAPPGPRLGASSSGPGGTVPRTVRTGRFDAERWQTVRDVANAWEVSPTALLLTLFSEAWERIGTPAPFALTLTTSERMRLPADTARVVGPFTSSMVFVARPAAGRSLETCARDVHQRLWEDLGHATVSGVEVLRAMRRDEAPAVVFTSMIDGTDGATTEAAEGFARRTRYVAGQTSSVALDHQMWIQDGELGFRWDIAESRFAPGHIELLYAYFVNAVESLESLSARPRPPLNELQQAYFVARAHATEGEGCLVALSFDRAELDRERLAGAWTRLLSAYPALRATVSEAGDLVVPARAPRRWYVPELADSDEEMSRALAARPFPLARGPHTELRIVRTAQGHHRVHMAVDLLVLDAHSIRRLAGELFRFYADESAVAPKDEPEGHPGAGFGAGFGLGLDEAKAYWSERIGELPPGPPVDMAPSDGAPPHRVRREAKLNSWAGLRARIEDRGLSVDAVLLAAFTEVIAEWCAEPFAVPVVRWTRQARRRDPGEHTALSWVTDHRGAPLLTRAAHYERELARDAEADAASGLAHVRRLTLRRRTAGAAGERPYAHPVVYTSVFDGGTRAGPGPDVLPGPWLTSTPGVWLDAIAVDQGDELLYCWDAVDAGFPAGLLDELFARYGELLGRLADDVSATPEPRPPDQDSLPRLWNDTERPFPVPGPAHLLFEEQARLRPDAVALRWRGDTMTYGELNRRANRIAWRLRDRGVGPGTVVGICHRRGPAMVAAVFGVLKAGGAYLPLEPSLPERRAGLMLRTAGACTLLTGMDEARWPVPDGVTAVYADTLDADPREETDPLPSASPDDTAYIIFTSGSTGAPKGVTVTHRPLLNLLNWCYRTHHFGPDDVGLCVTSLGFDLSVFDVLGLLGCGAGLYIADAAQQRDPQLLLDVLLTEPVTFWNSAPTTLHQLMPLLPTAEGPGDTGRLRLVFLSGDYTPLTLPDDLRAVFTEARLVSLGGATEATVWSNHFEVGEVDPAWRSIPYGRPIDNARYYILGPDRRPCPVGESGDLYIGGDCLSQGYVGQPELTAERFVTDPFVPRPDARMYRTGDRASYFPDGTICFLGRDDHQVKVRGFRVELGEIEHQLRSHPSVKDVVVLAQPDGGGDRRVVAYVIPLGPPPRLAELRAHAAEDLPDYMVPNAVAYLRTFPATDNGKVDRAALPWPLDAAESHAGLAGTEPTEAGVEAEPSGAPAAAPDESAVREHVETVFAGLLGSGGLDPEADLWDQGATSFTMVRASAALMERLGLRIPVDALLVDPTVRGISRYAAAQLATSSAPDTAPPRPTVPQEVDFFSADERARFKAQAWNERSADVARPPLPLVGGPEPDGRYVRRATRREFLARPVPHEDFSRLLGLLRRTRIADADRSLYPSAGDTYAVQVYAHVRPGGVDGVAAGLYYYRPADHALQWVADAGAVGRQLHFSYNRQVYDAAGFEIFLIGQSHGIAPLYGDNAELYLSVEAGYMGQLLMGEQVDCGVGLCPVGGLAYDRLREALRLDEGHRFLHSFMGGAVDHGAVDRGVVDQGAVAHVSAPPVPVVVPAPLAVPVAVTGMAGRFAATAGLDDLWELLSQGRRSLGAPPAARKGQVPEGLTGGFLSDIEGFESLLFAVPPVEAATLDPQVRLLLQAVWSCLEDSGHTAASLSRSAGRVGVFVAAMWPDFQQVGADRWGESGDARLSALAADLPNRVSHVFDFRGPSVAVNTSCSSSLTAVHAAVESLRRGECGAAVVAAVNVMAHPYHGALLDGLGLLAPHGSAGAFDADSAGWVPGEGVGALLLRPEPAAIGDGDVRRAVIEATWIGHSGRADRYGAPSAQALKDSLRQCLRQGGLDPSDIDYVECAAAGASLADAAELEALGAVFGPAAGPVNGQERQHQAVPVGTLKPNIGHLESAAGLSQLAKILLQFEHGQLAPTLLAPHRNPLVAWNDLPLRVVDELRAWRSRTPDVPLRALVNSLGATGSYAHVVLRAPAPHPSA